MSPGRVVGVGGLAVHWLQRSQPIEDAQIDRRLRPEERAFARSIKSRRRRDEYRRSRYLIRELSSFDGSLPRTPAGAPSWPPGVVGSLTHKDGAVGVCLADASTHASVGIDAEDEARVHVGLAERICRPEEWKRLERLAIMTGLAPSHLLALTFSFKESLFKAHYPLGQTMFYFHDAELVEIDPNRAVVCARILVDVGAHAKSGSEWRGGYTVVESDDARMLVTALSVPSSRCLL